jgi:hypothetical protein
MCSAKEFQTLAKPVVQQKTLENKQKQKNGKCSAIVKDCQVFIRSGRTKKNRKVFHFFRIV